MRTAVRQSKTSSIHRQWARQLPTTESKGHSLFIAEGDAQDGAVLGVADLLDTLRNRIQTVQTMLFASRMSHAACACQADCDGSKLDKGVSRT